MYKSDKKLLVSGCGITFSGQQSKTWVNVMNLTGIDIVDVSAPAVSNQWIINRAFMQLEADPEIKHAVIQLTAIGKLDVEVNEERIKNLVEPDTIRNFTVDNVWPSSASVEHESKRLWKQWLSSPALEQQDIICKLRLLKHWCDCNNVALLVIQGYDLHWTAEQQKQLYSVIDNIDYNIMHTYQQTGWYKQRVENMDVPVLGFQIELARQISQKILPDLCDKIEKVGQDFARSCR